MGQLIALGCVLPFWPDFLAFFKANNKLPFTNAIIVFQAISSIITYLLFPFLYTRYYNQRLLSKIAHIEINKPLLFLWVFALAVLLIPILFWVVKFNESLAFGGLEETFVNAENEAKAITELFMNAQGIWLYISILVVAVIPAIAEEFLFRGVLQGLFIQSGVKFHWAIWLSAFVFSFMHFQFFGFIPRMLLGACFGYLFYYSGNIWLPIFGHFLNNLFATLEYRILGEGGLDFTAHQYLVGLAAIGIFFVWKEILKETNPFIFNPEHKKWVVLSQFNTEQEASIVKLRLEQAGIPAVLLNKKDSSYLFGYTQVNVPALFLEKATILLKENGSEE